MPVIYSECLVSEKQNMFEPKSCQRIISMLRRTAERRKAGHLLHDAPITRRYTDAQSVAAATDISISVCFYKV